MLISLTTYIRIRTLINWERKGNFKGYS